MDFKTWLEDRERPEFVDEQENDYPAKVLLTGWYEQYER